MNQCALICDFMWDKTREARGSFELRAGVAMVSVP